MLVETKSCYSVRTLIKTHRLWSKTCRLISDNQRLPLLEFRWDNRHQPGLLLLTSLLFGIFLPHLSDANHLSVSLGPTHREGQSFPQTHTSVLSAFQPAGACLVLFKVVLLLSALTDAFCRKITPSEVTPAKLLGPHFPLIPWGWELYKSTWVSSR